ncbi:AT-rich interactive domain-containing protein 1B-like [Corvus moneduloides]|uniref:AT-rich interactive domain-containing protein 1B-like n=1 Tax=Corvus moneduloides TaxID=1196302 RepID=UPI001364149D|nr:AT-rich interactive domain-containing protein 1B-like [Corvus moneduloides]
MVGSGAEQGGGCSARSGVTCGRRPRCCGAGLGSAGPGGTAAVAWGAAAAAPGGRGGGSRSPGMRRLPPLPGVRAEWCAAAGTGGRRDGASCGGLTLWRDGNATVGHGQPDSFLLRDPSPLLSCMRCVSSAPFNLDIKQIVILLVVVWVFIFLDWLM